MLTKEFFELLQVKLVQVSHVYREPLGYSKPFSDCRRFTVIQVYIILVSWASYKML